MSKTIADSIADILGNDGTTFVSTDGQGLTLTQLAEIHGASKTRNPRDSEQIRYDFPDGSVITESGAAWDLGYPGCWCWAGAHQSVAAHLAECPEHNRE